jgi:hypothetical protein
MLDNSSKGGRSVILRCSSQIRYESGCPFYCRIRVSNRDGKWYICTGLDANHNCPPDIIPPRFHNIDGMLHLYYSTLEAAVAADIHIEEDPEVGPV